MKTGAVIAVSALHGPAEALSPMTPVGRSSAAQRIIAAFHKAGVSPIVIVSDGKSKKLERRLAQRGVLFLHDPGGAPQNAFSAFKTGLAYLQDQCGKVFLIPASIPLFLPSTLERMLQCGSDIVIPSYKGQAGFPILVAKAAMAALLSDDAGGGMDAVLSRCAFAKEYLAVEDEGVLIPANAAQAHPHRKLQSSDLACPVLDASISMEAPLLDSRLMALLQLIDESKSVRTACNMTQISYSAAWNSLNAAEDALGYPLATRNKGGRSGGGTFLTPKGRALMEAYARFEADLQEQAQTLYAQYFKNIL